jgi:hypothetical protein
MPMPTWLVCWVIDQFVVALVAGEDRAGPDDQGYAEAGEVFGAVEAVGVAGCGLAAGDREPGEHDRRGGHVGQVVQGIAQQRHRSGDQGEGEFDGGGGGQADR